MKNKETYALLDMSIIEFENADVIVTSIIETEENETPLVSNSN